MEVREVPNEATHDLRRQVLRDGRADAVVVHVEDAVPGAFSLAVVDPSSDALVAIVSAGPEPTPFRPGARAARFRGMAVAPAAQGTGVGRLLVVALVERLASDGYDVAWANARDNAMGFYEKLGFVVVGEQFVTAATGLPHHVVVRDLRP